MTRRWNFGVIALIISCLWSFSIPGFAQEKPKFLVQGESSQTKKTTPFVIISREYPAYTVFYVIAKMPPDPKKRALFEKLIDQAQGTKQGTKVEIVDWSQFIQNADGYVIGALLKNDYPSVKLTQGFVELLKLTKKEGEKGQGGIGPPWGVTWNGGVAFMRTDYNHAEKIFAVYSKNPLEYERTKITDRRKDPIHPNNHFLPLLKRAY